MHYKNILLLMLLFSFSILSAQQQTKHYRVNFKVNDYRLDLTNQKVLNDLITEIKTSPYTETAIAAHTDNDAGDAYNLDLSNKRAETVSKYLTANGIRGNQIEISSFGERKPIADNITKVGKYENRCVDITLKIYAIHSISELLKNTTGSYKQTFNIKPNSVNTITAKNGTAFTIPANAILNADGQAIGSNMVTIEVEEYLKPEDAVYNQLSTTSDERLLQSGGMFTINASINGSPLKLKPGKTIDVVMPSANIKTGMEVFTGIKNPEGIMEWKPTAKPFNVLDKNKKEAPFTKVNTAYLKTLMVPVLTVDKANLAYTYTLAHIPVRPVQPKQLKNMKSDNQKMFTRVERFLLPARYMNRKIGEANARIEQAYTKAQQRYNKRLETYQVALEKYRFDSLQYETEEVTKYKLWVTTQKKIIDDEILFINQRAFNNAINQLITLSDSNRLKSTNPYSLFLNLCNPKRVDYFTLWQQKYLSGRFAKLQTMTMAGAIADYADKGIIDVNLKANDCMSGTYFYNNNTTDFAQELVNQHPALLELFNTAQNDILTKRELQGMIDAGTVNNVYNASLSGFGVYNCDRFDNTPKDQMVQVNIRYNGAANISFYVPSLNSFIYAYRNGTDYSLSLPKNTDVKMVFVAFDNTAGPMFVTMKKRFMQNETIIPQPLPVKLNDLKKGLAML